MSQPLKCPNPSCPFLFDPSQVPPGAMLTCPRCTMRFTLGNTAPPPSPPVENRQATAAPKKVPFIYSRAATLLGIGLMIIVTVAGLVLAFRTPKQAPVVNEKLREFRDINFSFLQPDGWEADDTLRAKAKANVTAIRKTDSSARVAIAYTALRDRNPQPGELREGITIDRLRGLISDLETTPAEGEWLKQPGVKLTFRGRSSEGNLAGFAYGVGVHGCAYWFIAWCLESEFTARQTEFDEIAKSCKLINPNLDWKPTTDAATIIDAGEFKLRDGDGWWEQQPEPTSEDPKAILLLTAKFKSKIRNEIPEKAYATVYKFSSLDALRSHVKDYYGKLFSIKNWRDVSDDPQGDPPNAGMPPNADALRLHAESEEPRTSKLMVLHASGNHSILAYCPWSERAKWEKRLIALCSSLK